MTYYFTYQGKRYPIEADSAYHATTKINERFGTNYVYADIKGNLSKDPASTPSGTGWERGPFADPTKAYILPGMQAPSGYESSAFAPPGGAPLVTTSKWTAAQQADFDEYRAVYDTGLFPNLPNLKTPEEYFAFVNHLVADEGYYFSPVKATMGQYEEWERFKAFQGQYGELNDFSANNFADFINNYSSAQNQLNTWIQRAGPEAAGFTDDQIRAYADYKQWYYEYGKPGEWMPVDVGDFLSNQDKAQQQLGVWQQTAAEVEQYELSPEEAARRREEAYAESRYAAQERYRETPGYGQVFTPWLEEQGQFSGALAGFVEKEYPSLVSRFQATQPREIGYPTREEARAEAARREAGFKAWLGEEMPEVEQKYWGQTPLMRGERPYMYQPTTRGLNW